MTRITMVCVGPYWRGESMRTVAENKDREVMLDACGEV